ncbi:hypothetical protein KCU85_g72, partial [Aureobasidium melanogenum]
MAALSSSSWSSSSSSTNSPSAVSWSGGVIHSLGTTHGSARPTLAALFSHAGPVVAKQIVLCTLEYPRTVEDLAAKGSTWWFEFWLCPVYSADAFAIVAASKNTPEMHYAAMTTVACALRMTASWRLMRWKRISEVWNHRKRKKDTHEPRRQGLAIFLPCHEQSIKVPCQAVNCASQQGASSQETLMQVITCVSRPAED